MQININMSAIAAVPKEGSTAPAPLATLALGASATVVAVREPGAVGERILEMGLTPGTRVEVVRRSLLGGVLQVRVRDTVLTVRRSVAERIDVAPTGARGP